MMTALPTTPSFRLDGRRALVTGAGRGLGLASAAALAEAGAHVVLAARSTEEIQEASRMIGKRGGSAEALTLDVTDTETLATRLREEPAFDVLVNNAGINRPQFFTDVTPDDFRAVMDVNLSAAFFVAQDVARAMIKAGVRGSIIQMSSQMGHVGGANRTVYCASKAAIEGLSKAMAIDLAPHHIRVNTICPTFIETPMTAGFFSVAGFREEVLGKIKLGRLGRLEDIMGAVVFLASDAASLMTGSSLLVDGGWTAE